MRRVIYKKKVKENNSIKRCYGHYVTDRNRDTQDMRPYASADAGCTDCWRRALRACVLGIKCPKLFGV